MSSKINTPLESQNSETNVIYLLKPNLRPSRNLLLVIFVALLFGTALYFGCRSYNLRKKIEIPNKEETISDKLVNSKAPFKEENTPEQPLALPPPPPSQGDKISVHVEEPDESSGTTSSSSENPYIDNVILYSDNEDEIKNVQMAIFLKTMLKNMKCVLGEITPTSVSCCGKMALENDPDKDEEACILMDTYEVENSEDTIYRLRMIKNQDLLIYKEVKGFPEKGSECFSVKGHPGVDICVLVNVLAQDEDVSDDLGYQTCTYMKFGYGNDVPDLLGFAETINCNSDKESINKKSYNSSQVLILRLKLSSIEEIRERKNQGVTKISNSLTNEVSVGERKTDDVVNNSLVAVKEIPDVKDGNSTDNLNDNPATEIVKPENATKFTANDSTSTDSLSDNDTSEINSNSDSKTETKDEKSSWDDEDLKRIMDGDSFSDLDVEIKPENSETNTSTSFFQEIIQFFNKNFFLRLKNWFRL